MHHTGISFLLHFDDDDNLVLIIQLHIFSHFTHASSSFVSSPLSSSIAPYLVHSRLNIHLFLKSYTLETSSIQPNGLPSLTINRLLRSLMVSGFSYFYRYFYFLVFPLWHTKLVTRPVLDCRLC